MPLIRHAGIAGLLLVSACGSHTAPQGGMPPPTDFLSFNRSWSSSAQGYIYVSSYFTEGQVDDRAWEKRRLDKMEQVRICRTGERILHRDVRWFPATQATGRKCAAIVYTMACDIPTLAKNDSLESDRQEALVGELDQMPEKGCGQLRSEADSAKPNSDISDYLAVRSLLVDQAVCDFRQPRLDGRMTIQPTTRIGSSTKVEKGLAARVTDDWALERITIDLRDDPKDMIGGRLRTSGRLGAIFPPKGKVARIPTNIELTQAIGLGRDGRPYCVQLTARQGDQVWRRTIERSGREAYAGIGVFGDRPSYNAKPTLRDDMRELVEALIANMGLPPPRSD